jgi:DNA-binding response OmpR family regulator
VGEGTRRKVVQIEDDPDIRGLVESILKAGGYDVASTADALQAADFVRREKPDLILCDIVMPDIDGYGVLKALQSNPDTARYPVVFLTAQRGFTERVQAFKYGVVDYITKPFTREVLLRKVERVMDGLDRRAGVVSGQGGALLEEVQRESRTGVLSVKGEGGESRVLIQAGQVVGHRSVAPGESAPAEFRELNPDFESIVVHDPPRLPGSADRLPSFAELPEGLRSALVVEDNPVFRRFLRDLLQSQGFAVDEAGDGEEALKIALENRPWLILTDIDMPVIDGVEFCRRVRSHSLIRHTPLIFLSGWDDYKERYRGLEAGADEFLSKETPVRELLIRIRLVLKRFFDMGSRRARGPEGMEGVIELIGTPGFLQMCHLGRLTGLCTVQARAGTFEVGFRDGEIVWAKTGELAGVPAIFEFLSWDAGRFEFVPGDPGQGEPLGESFDQILLEGCRRLDERRRPGSEAAGADG